MDEPLNFRTGGRRKKRRDWDPTNEDSSLLDEPQEELNKMQRGADSWLKQGGMLNYNELSVSRNDRNAGTGTQSYAINKPSRRQDTMSRNDESVQSGPTNRVKVPSRRTQRRDDNDQMWRDLSDLEEDSE